MALLSLSTNGQLQPGLSREWLLTNGSGAFANSTVVGCNTRKYHGLLVAALHPPVGRVVMLSKVGEIVTFVDKNKTHELSVNQFGDSFHPRGDQYLKRFDLDQSAEWTYQVEGASIVKRLTLHPNYNGAQLTYSINPNGRTMKLELLPFLAMRDFHATRRGTDGRFESRPTIGGVTVRHGQLQLRMSCRGAEWKFGPDWWRDFTYAIEIERGQDAQEDLFVPGRFVATIDEPVTIALDFAAAAEPAQKSPAGAPVPEQGVTPTIAKLRRAAHDFVVARTNPDGTTGRTVIAGYPWFADWGRDTMISLPGLFLATKRFDEAKSVLGVFAQYVSQGMIPNRFNDYSNEPEYNTVDASLWYVHACFEYRNASNDVATFEKILLPACQQIIDGYSAGTRYKIAEDKTDGLITQGDATTQLTWMDAKMGDIVFTPRQGKAVEINALWYNALVLLGRKEQAERVRQSFVKAFWLDDKRGLADVVTDGKQDTSIRPNQIFAVSLPNSPLSPQQQAAVVEVVRRELLTPYGLRTLAASDPNYQPLYSGDQFHRDRAYHNGTVWPWLIGPFLDAYLRANNNSAAAKLQAITWLKPLINALDTEGCLGQLAEIYEAKEPHRPVGCYAQAWSIAEVLRLAVLLKI